MSTTNEGRNLERINEKYILNFGDLAAAQTGTRGPKAWIKCERCNNRLEAEWKSDQKGGGQWNVTDKEDKKEWSVYLKKAQVKKNDVGYFIVGGIKFYCPNCDLRYNYLER